MGPQDQLIIVKGDLEDLFTVCYVIIDDLYKAHVPVWVQDRPGPKPSLSDSEVLTISVVGELFGMDVESRWHSLVRNCFGHLFPKLIERSRFNRRRRELGGISNWLRHHLMLRLVDPNDPWRLVDSFPLIVANWGRRVRCKVARDEAGFSTVHSKRQPFYGYRIHLLITLTGLITNFALAAANVHDSRLMKELAYDQGALVALGDKAYNGVQLEKDLQAEGVQLIALSPKRVARQLPRELAKTVRSARQLVETVGSQLTQIFYIERNLAKSPEGIKARLMHKLLAHTVGYQINVLSGRPPLQMASLIY